jgi:hypothetical protein
VDNKRVTGVVFTTGQRSSHHGALGYDGFWYCLSHCWLWLLVVMVIPSHHLPQAQHSLHQSQDYHLQMWMFPAVCSEWHQNLPLCCYQTVVHQGHLLSLQTDVNFSFNLQVFFLASFLVDQRGGCTSLYQAYCVVVGVSVVPFVPNTDDFGPDEVGHCVVLKFWFQLEMVHSFPCS